MGDCAHPEQLADHQHPSCNVDFWRTATWALPLSAQPILAVAVSLQRGLWSWEVVHLRDGLAPILGGAVPALIAIMVAVLGVRSATARTRARSASLLTAAVIVIGSAVGIGVLLHDGLIDVGR